MMFTVVWKPTATNELAHIWLRRVDALRVWTWPN